MFMYNYDREFVMKKKYHLYSSMPMLGNHKSYAEIDIGALKHNYKKIKAMISQSSNNTSVMCVLKADAYGHGAKNCCLALLEEGCRFFAVSSIEEAIDIRNVCNAVSSDAEILLLGYTLPTQAALLSEYKITASLIDPDFALELAKEAEKAGVIIRAHIKLDTGMNRIGFAAKTDEDISKTVSQIIDISKSKNIDICGMFTHFSKADEDIEEFCPHSFTTLQAERFQKTDRALLDAGIDVKFRHVCNSAAAMGFPEYHFDACRVGITLYGTHTSRTVDKYGLLPVMKLCTVIAHKHTLSEGDSVSYGGIYTAKDNRTVAVIPIGYADGFIRRYTGADVTVLTKNGAKKASVIGRICMDQCMIDITDIEAEVGDKVIIFGNSADELTKLAKKADTIEYECICLITSRVPRIVTGTK